MDIKTQVKGLASLGGLVGLFVMGYKNILFTGKFTHSSIVDSGHRAVKFNKLTGMNEKIFKEGWHLMLPWFERPYIFDVRTHPTTIKSTTGSKGK